MKKNAGKGQWIEELLDSQGKFVYLTTLDGVYREGKMTGFTVKTMLFNNVEVGTPTEIELNGDVNDRVAIDRIEKMEIRS